VKGKGTFSFLERQDRCVRYGYNERKMCKPPSRKQPALWSFYPSSLVQLEQYFTLLKIQLWNWPAESDCQLWLTEYSTWLTYDDPETCEEVESSACTWNLDYSTSCCFLDFRQSTLCLFPWSILYILCNHWAAVSELIYWAIKRRRGRIGLEVAKGMALSRFNE